MHYIYIKCGHWGKFARFFKLAIKIGQVRVRDRGLCKHTILLKIRIRFFDLNYFIPPRIYHIWLLMTDADDANIL